MSLQSDASQIAWDITQNPCVGYSQPERLTIWNLPSPTSQAVNVNVDCSELVVYCFNNAGLPDPLPKSMWTGNEVACMTERGFTAEEWYPGMPVEDGDVLRSDGHTAIVCNGWICEAWISEFGDIDGYAGDQTGGEVRCACSYLNHPLTIGAQWTHRIRYDGSYYAEDDLDMSENTDLLREIRDRLVEVSDQTGAGIAGRRWDGPIVSQLKDANSTLSSLVDTFSPGKEGVRNPGSAFYLLYQISDGIQKVAKKLAGGED